MKTFKLITSAVLLAAIFALPVRGAETNTADAAGSAEELAKKVQNPVADLISVPIQYNLGFNAGPYNLQQNVINIQPVIPIKLSEDWNLITRTIIPILAVPDGGRDGHAGGVGDLQITAFLSPAKAKKFIWGVGPIVQLPTATQPVLGQGMYCLGPSAVALTMQGPIVAGVLANNIWSVGGWRSQNVNQMLVQPFFNYNFKHGWYFTSAPIMTANWEEGVNHGWTIPVGGGFGKLVRFGKLPVNLSVQAFSNVLHPDNTPNWSMRFQVQFLFPK
jgi:hypothetical protein